MTGLCADPSRGVHVDPVGAGALRDTRRDALAREAVFLKDANVPRVQAGGAEEDATAEPEGAVDGLDLGRGVGAVGRKPIHAVHDDADGERLGLHARKHLGQLVRVDAEVVERSGLGQRGVRPLAEVRRV